MKRTAIVYDFDGTLAKGNIQEHSFIPSLGMSAVDFWKGVKDAAKANDADEILTYMWKMIELSRKTGRPLTRDLLRDHGRSTPLFDGLDDWFSRIGAYAESNGLSIEHYVISSGVYEMIAGSPVFDKLRLVFASRFIYDESGNAIWPAVAINYTTKTQFLFRINKGITNTWDNEQINRWIPLNKRPIPFERVVFLGDGETDIPSMKMIRHQGGYPIAVFDPVRWDRKELQDKIYNLISEDRVNFVAPADYRDGSQLDITVKGILGKIGREQAQ